MTNPNRAAVLAMVRQIGACSLTEVAACLSLPNETVEACLHELAVDRLVRVHATTGGRKGKRFAWVYWSPTDYKGTYHAIRKQQREKFPGVFERVSHVKGKVPRVLIRSRIEKLMVEAERPLSSYEICDFLGSSYSKTRRSLIQLEQEGKIMSEKEVYGRGRPRLLWSLVKLEQGVVEDDESAVVEWID